MGGKRTTGEGCVIAYTLNSITALNNISWQKRIKVLQEKELDYANANVMAGTLWSACGKCETKWPAQAHIKHIMCHKTPHFTLYISIDFTFFFSISLLPFVRRWLAVTAAETKTSADNCFNRPCVRLSCLSPILAEQEEANLLIVFAEWLCNVRYCRWKMCANRMKSEGKWFERTLTSAHACKSARHTHFFSYVECLRRISGHTRIGGQSKNACGYALVAINEWKSQTAPCRAWLGDKWRSSGVRKIRKGEGFESPNNAGAVSVLNAQILRTINSTVKEFVAATLCGCRCGKLQHI